MTPRDALDVARLLLKKARQDEALVRKIGSDTDIADEIVGFHAQQAVEKQRPLTIRRRAGIMKVMAAEEQLVHVTLSGDINGEYVVKDEGPDGEITLVPDTSAQAILDRLGHTQATLAEFEAEYGAVLPPDGEG
jgi:hypothetical protein